MIRTFAVLSIISFCIGISASPAQVDAVTAATMNNSCQITSLTATSSSFTVMWTEDRSGGTMVIQYGTTNPPTTSKAVSSSERAAKSITITGLQPATKYYVVITMTKSGETPYGANGEVTTQAGTSVLIKNLSKNGGISIMKTTSGIAISGKETNANSSIVTLCNAKGGVVLTKRLNVENGLFSGLLKTGALVPGAYFMSIKAGNSSFHKQIIINR